MRDTLLLSHCRAAVSIDEARGRAWAEKRAGAGRREKHQHASRSLYGARFRGERRTSPYKHYGVIRSAAPTGRELQRD
jgi:hypothetical protein